GQGSGKNSPTIDTPAATIADREGPGLRGEPPGHLNDQPQVGNADPGGKGLGHQFGELPNQAASHAAVEDANNGHADHGQGSGKNSPTIDTPATTIAESDAPGSRGEARGHVNDQPQVGNADPGNNGLGHQSGELPNQA